MITHSKRLGWLDIAKAIAIILMVLGHTSIPQYASNFIYAFHMPLFFIASGWTTNWEKYSFGEFFIRRVRTLLMPFILYSAIVLAIMILHGWDTIGEWLVKGWGDGYALWFIPVLIIATTIVKTLYAFREVGGGRLFWIVVVLVLCLGIDFHCLQIRLPWALSSIPYAVLMVVIGSEWSKIEFKPRGLHFMAVMPAILIVALISHSWRLDMCFNSIIPILPLTIGAITGTMMVFLVSSLIEKYFKRLSPVLISIGKETYIIVAFSQITIMLLNEYFQLNVAIKYALLIMILIMIKYIKDAVNNVFKTKII